MGPERLIAPAAPSVAPARSRNPALAQIFFASEMFRRASANRRSNREPETRSERAEEGHHRENQLERAEAALAGLAQDEQRRQGLAVYSAGAKGGDQLVDQR